MIFQLQKQSAESLPRQISAFLRKRIHCGEYPAGSRLGTIRELAAEFSVSTLTVIKALDILDEEGLIQRVPVKGTFVRPATDGTAPVLHACLAFPEHTSFQELTHPENWALNSELHRGLLYEARRSGIVLQYMPFSTKALPSRFEAHLSLLRQFDFIVFPGQRLLALQEAIAEERPTFSLQDAFSAARRPLSSRIIPVDYDRADAEKRLLTLLHASGCSSAAVIADSNRPLSPRIFSFLSKVVRAGIRTPSEGLWLFSSSRPDWPQQIISRIRACPGIFLFCDASDHTCRLYEAFHNAHLTVGQDLMMTGIASGISFSGLLPRYTYLKIPRFEMGRKIIRTAQKAIRSKHGSHFFPRCRVELIQGDSAGIRAN